MKLSGTMLRLLRLKDMQASKIFFLASLWLLSNVCVKKCLVIFFLVITSAQENINPLYSLRVFLNSVDITLCRFKVSTFFCDYP